MFDVWPKQILDIELELNILILNNSSFSFNKFRIKFCISKHVKESTGVRVQKPCLEALDTLLIVLDQETILIHRCVSTHLRIRGGVGAVRHV